MDFVKDRVALIAGAGNGVGEAIAKRLARNGAKIAVVGFDSKHITPMTSELTELGTESMGLVLNLNDSKEITRAIEEVRKKLGKIDILTNAFDYSVCKGVCDVSDADWNSSLQSNLTRTFFFCRGVIPGMRENKYGRIINLSSLYYLGWPGKSNYAASQSGIFGLTRSLALELAKEDITVNCVALGDILTSDCGFTEEEAAKMAENQPVKRLGTPEDVACSVAFLASDKSKYITGQTLFVCGGKSVYSSMSM